MQNTKPNVEMLTFFKALADKNRLKIVGLLAQKPYSVEELATTLHIGASTVSHHLSVLSKAGLVTGKVQGYYSMYSLQTQALEESAKILLHREDVKGFAVDASDGNVFDQKVLKTFLTEEGRITSFPTQEKKSLVLLRYVLKEFKQDEKYTEKQVNQIIARFTKDTARVRRAFIDYKFMERQGGGGKYWRTGKE